LKETKSSLQDRGGTVLGDFWEIYSFTIQDAAQGFHSVTSKPLFMPMLAILKILRMSCKLCFAIISECLCHDTVMVYTFQKHLIAFFKENAANISKIYYFAYGASAQYKNKNSFINLCRYNTDFGVNAEWHFFATSHGKGSYDGVSGTIKRLSARSSLQHHQILTPAQPCSWAKEHLPSLHVQYCCNCEVEQTRHRLKFSFENTRTVVRTRQYRAFLPVSSTTLVAKKYSVKSKMAL
jgi:hypothetical protein